MSGTCLVCDVHSSNGGRLLSLKGIISVWEVIQGGINELVCMLFGPQKIFQIQDIKAGRDLQWGLSEKERKHHKHCLNPLQPHLVSD